MLQLVRWVVLLAPVGVFALVLPLAAHAGAALVGAIGFYIAAYSAACLGVTALLYPVVALGAGIPMKRFARAALPAQLIAFSSSSSIASLPALVQSADSLALPKRVSGFVLPLAVAMFKIAGPVAWTVGALGAGLRQGMAQIAVAAAAMALITALLSWALRALTVSLGAGDVGHWSNDVLQVLIAGGGGLLVYVAVLWRLRFDEVLLVWRRVRSGV